ncbi:MaoC family dehydratase N-terminal domain-containing protein [Paenibacillus glucanolyticus]|uniref:FAS1-like dehydratase domain-containing protein n=1 Tax=Paenibacillus glucanolyticus TaxID=59843 RepID=UPI0030CA114F
MNKLEFAYHLTPEAILAYAHSTETPLQKIDGTWLAPPTMPVTFWTLADVPWLDKERTFIHGSQSFAYEKPLLAGAHLDCVLTLTRMEQKTGHSGALTLYTHLLECRCKGELVVSAETVLISLEDHAWKKR